MKIVRTKQELTQIINELKQNGTKIAFVPTMGNLHNGHITLVKKGREYADFVIVSIFVNKKQFGANEDFASYPRTEAEDIAKLKEAHANLVYIPKDEGEIFGENFSLTLDVPHLTKCLCGISRPNFFGGVLAVVTKLFLQVKPDFAIFGKKDYQQFLVVSALAKSLDIGIEVVGVDTVREAKGLALSSRNNYFKEEDREKANFIYAILSKVKSELLNGRELKSVLQKASLELLENGIERIDYLEVRNSHSLSLIESFNANEKAILFFAGFFKGVRLIDNIEIF